MLFFSAFHKLGLLFRLKFVIMLMQADFDPACKTSQYCGKGQIRMKKLYYIANLRSGKRAIRAKLASVIDTFTAAGYEVTVRTTQAPMDACAAAEYACLTGAFDMVVCSGGDGTLNEVIQGVMFSEQPLPVGYIPCGSTNDFSKSLRYPADIEKAAQWLMHGHPYQCDIGRFNGRHFLYVASFGAFTSTVLETPQNVKNVIGHMAYVLYGMTHLSDIRPLHLKIEADDRQLDDEFIFGMVSNTASVAGMLKLRDFRLDDGVFEVMLIRKPGNVIDLQRIIASLLNLDEDVDPRYVEFFRSSHLHIISDEEITWTLDGEYGGENCEFDLGVCSRAVTLCVGDDAPYNDGRECAELFIQDVAELGPTKEV